MHNAARHSRSHAGQPLALVVTVQGGADLVITVADSGAGGETLATSGGARPRLAPHATTLELAPAPEGGVSAVIRVIAEWLSGTAPIPAARFDTQRPIG